MDKLYCILESLRNPDWWNVAATAFVGLMAWWLTYRLGKRQEELQEQQIALAEYEINKQLYSTVKDIDELSTTLIIRIYSHFCGTAFVTCKRDLLTEIQDEINKIGDKFNDCILDFELKLGCGWESVDYYQRLITTMNNIVVCVKVMESEKSIGREVSIAKSTDEDHIIKALAEIVTENYKSGFKEMLYSFIETRERAIKIEALKKIKERIKPISAK